MHSDIRAALNAMSPALPGTFPNGLATRKYMVDYASATHVVKNTTTVPVTVWIYDITPRNDSAGALPIAAWQGGITEQAVTLPNSDNVTTNTMVGSTPF